MFLGDSFTSFTEPAVARAAIELLEAAGWTVRLEAGACCGRASLSKGLLDQAGRQARQLAGRVAAPWPDRRCRAVLPADAARRLPRAAARRPAGPGRRAASTLPEELLLEAIADGRLTLSPIAGKRILFHGHCHQKAVTGTAATVALLRDPRCRGHGGGRGLLRNGR